MSDRRKPDLPPSNGALSGSWSYSTVMSGYGIAWQASVASACSSYMTGDCVTVDGA